MKDPALLGVGCVPFWSGISSFAVWGLASYPLRGGVAERVSLVCLCDSIGRVVIDRTALGSSSRCRGSLVQWRAFSRVTFPS